MLNAVAPLEEQSAGSALRSPRAAPTGARDHFSGGVPQKPPWSCWWLARAGHGAGVASGHGVLWGGVGQEELTRFLGPPDTPQPLPRTPAPAREGATLPWVCCRVGGHGENKGVSALAGNNIKISAFGKGSEVCSGSAESAHRSLSISLCLALSWGRDYKSP